MQIVVTARELLDKRCWDRFCDVTGTNPWCINEGLADSDTTFTLTEEQAFSIGITKEVRESVYPSGLNLAGFGGLL